MVESEIAKAPNLSLGGGGHGGVLGFSPHPRRYDETMASKWDRRLFVCLLTLESGNED